MKIVETGSNYTVIEAADKLILFSYKTPVAYKEDGKVYRTDKFHSVTTSKHIGKFGATKGERVGQAVLDKLLEVETC